MKLLRAWLTLVMLSFRRLLWSTGTLMVSFPLVVCGLFVVRRGYDSGRMVGSGMAFQEFSEEVLIGIMASFVVPIVALAFGTTSVGAEREDRTLLFLLVRPIPRSLIFIGKFVAATPLVLGVVIGSFYIYCRLAGPAGMQAFDLYLPAIFYTSLAYLGLFHLLSAVFRHGTMVALVYALFVEVLLGNMPGIVKRVAINFYGRSMIFDIGAYEGLPGPDPEWFVPLTASAAASVLLAIAGGGLLLGTIIFSTREYRDLT